MMRRWIGIGVVAALSVGLVGPAEAATSLSVKESETALTEAVEEQMLEFVRYNYPSRMKTAVRSLQNGEGMMHKKLVEAVGFLKLFAIGPVTLEGHWERTGSGAKYMLLSVVRGVQNYPHAVVTFQTHPGMLRPYTIVVVDKDGDGKKDYQSTAICKREKMLEWLSHQFPLANIFSA